MVILGIDPGASGGIASLYANRHHCATFRLDVRKMPETPADVWELLVLAKRESSDWYAIIEQVGAMPKQGVASSFKFGVNFGMLIGLLTALEIPFERVAPGKWQRAMGCLSGGDKNVTKRKAQELFPHLKINHYIADALLLAEYGRRLLAQRNGGEQ